MKIKTGKNTWAVALERFNERAKQKEANVWARALRKSFSFKESDEEVVKPLEGSERALAELLAQNSQTSASTFVNLLKAKGFKIIAPEELTTEKSLDSPKPLIGQEAASASTTPAVVRAQESSIKDSFCGQMRFLESYSDESNPTRFRCVLIQEGLGNFGDAYYYTKQALESAVPVFEGKKIYADHPDAIEEKSRPERSVKDVLGHFENVTLGESEDGRAMLTADVVILPDEPYQWARALMRHAVEYSKKYPDKDFIGLSINARGDSTLVPIDEWVKEANIPSSSMEKIRQAKEKGISEIRLVTSIREAISCDMVTEAGAGGRIINFIERAK